MKPPVFVGQTVDDIMRSVIQAIAQNGDRVESSTQGANTELRGCLIELGNPRARLSRTETRGKPFSCLGELCWYLSKSNDFEFIKYYVPRKDADNEGGKVFGAYGPRLFDMRGNNQVEHIRDLLKQHPDSRRAVIQLFDAGDLATYHSDIPCTCTLQFMVRRDRLDMVSYMRSNDAYLGLPHDIFCFTMLQELLARSLSVELGTYRHMVGSLHLYDNKRELAQQFLDEGLQSTKVQMPPMPVGDPWDSVELLLEAEREIRVHGKIERGIPQGLAPYWADLVRLLLALRHTRDDETEKVNAIREQMAFPLYDSFLDARLRSA